jgi:octaprenyl-diphosphate synthase
MIERDPTGSPADLHALIETFFARSFGTDNPLITEAVRRMLAAGGKRLRPRLLLLAATAVGSDPRDHLTLAAYMELIHVATLIHDDVVDRADTRRGVNATAIDFGNRISVLAGDYLFAWIFRNVTAAYPPPIPHILSATLAEICDGEVLQLQALGNLDLTPDAYVDIVRLKTAALFAASAECGAIAGGGAAEEVRALREFGLNYGIAFQMLDDLLDLTGNETELGKPVGNDLSERKVTIPVVLAARTGDLRVRAALEGFYDDPQAAGSQLEATVATIVAAGVVPRTREAIAGYVERAKMSLAPLGAGPTRSTLIDFAEALDRDTEHARP